ncbi:MAG: PIG-L deacetylase family protein [Candidatus Thorarchaeota archaeon]
MIILAIGAHPDDIELGCGGTLKLFSSKPECSVYALVLSDGEMGGRPGDRRKETLESTGILDIEEVLFGDLPDTKIGEGIETISVIEDVVERIKPDLILTHSPKEGHQDHRNTALATYSAGRNVTSILSYETPSNLLYFSPQYFVNIEDSIDAKIESLKKHYTQSDKDYLETQAILGLAKYRGYQANVNYAEAYEVYRIVKKSINIAREF